MLDAILFGDGDEFGTRCLLQDCEIQAFLLGLLILGTCLLVERRLEFSCLLGELLVGRNGTWLKCDDRNGRRISG